MRQDIYGQIFDFKWLDPYFFSLLEEQGLAVYRFPAEPVSQELTQRRGLKCKVCWSNSRQQYTHLVWWIWHCSFSTSHPWIQLLCFSHKQNNLGHHDACMQLLCSPWTTMSHHSSLIWVNRLFKGNQHGKIRPDIFPSEKSNLCKLVEWHTWCGMHASLCSTMIIICEDTDFYLLFYYILHISLFTDIAPAHCLLSPLTASWI